MRCGVSTIGSDCGRNEARYVVCNVPSGLGTSHSHWHVCRYLGWRWFRCHSPRWLIADASIVCSHGRGSMRAVVELSLEVPLYCECGVCIDLSIVWGWGGIVDWEWSRRRQLGRVVKALAC